MHRWECTCGASCGGVWFDSVEEAQKRGDQHSLVSYKITKQDLADAREKIIDRLVDEG